MSKEDMILLKRVVIYYQQKSNYSPTLPIENISVGLLYI